MAYLAPVLSIALVVVFWLYAVEVQGRRRRKEPSPPLYVRWTANLLFKLTRLLPPPTGLSHSIELAQVGSDRVGWCDLLVLHLATHGGPRVVYLDAQDERELHAKGGLQAACWVVAQLTEANALPLGLTVRAYAPIYEGLAAQEVCR